MKSFLFLSFVRDLLALLSSGLIVAGTVAASFLEAAISHLLAGKAKSDMSAYIISQPLLVFYYIVLSFFLLIIVILALYYILRVLYEFALLSDRHLEKNECATFCFVRGIRICFIAAFFALFALFLCYWIFWTSILKSAFTRIEYYLELVELSGIDPSATVSPRIRQGTILIFSLICLFIFAVSLNILIVGRLIFNKLSLLGTSITKRQSNRVSLFRVRPVDLIMAGRHSFVFRQLWVSFLFDCIELLTVAIWLLYPLYVAVLWKNENKCFINLTSSDIEISPLLNCVISARFLIPFTAAIMTLLIIILFILYFLRFVEERKLLLSKIHNPATRKLSSIYAFGPLFILLFLVTCATTLISIIMLAKPFYSNLETEKQISLALPGLILLSGSVFALLYLGKKLTFSIAIHVNPRLSFFFEGAMALTSDQNVNTLKSNSGEVDDDDDDIVELSLYSPILDDDMILY